MKGPIAGPFLLLRCCQKYLARLTAFNGELQGAPYSDVTRVMPTALSRPFPGVPTTALLLMGLGWSSHQGGVCSVSMSEPRWGVARGEWEVALLFLSVIT